MVMTRPRVNVSVWGLTDVGRETEELEGKMYVLTPSCSDAEPCQAPAIDPMTRGKNLTALFIRRFPKAGNTVYMNLFTTAFLEESCGLRGDGHVIANGPSESSPALLCSWTRPWWLWRRSDLKCDLFRAGRLGALASRAE